MPLLCVNIEGDVNFKLVIFFLKNLAITGRYKKISVRHSQEDFQNFRCQNHVSAIVQQTSATCSQEMGAWLWALIERSLFIEHDDKIF